jgi:putative transposase
MSHAEQANYPTDLTDEQWQILRKLLPQPSRRGAPRTVCRRAVVDAILYVLRSGCAWRLLPHEFPNWKTVYGIFHRWRDDGTWQRIHDSLRDKLRRKEGRKASPSAAIIDSQTVKTTEVGGERGYDAGKKVNGRKRHIVVDTLGLILAVVVHSANVQDYDGAVLVLGILGRLKARFHRLKVIFADSAYGRNNLPECVRDAFGWLLQTVLRPVNVKGIVVLPKRWIVERTFGWLGRYRRHSKDYERNTASSEAMIYIAMTHVMLRRLARGKT